MFLGECFEFTKKKNQVHFNGRQVQYSICRFLPFMGQPGPLPLQIVRFHHAILN